jgi:hypothetical protein
MINSLIQGIEELNSRKRSGELALLCLTGKSENHLRDVIAFNVTNKNPSLEVAREKSRVDLLIKNKKGNTLFIEFKLGFAGVAIKQKENAPFILSAKKDVKMRGKHIVSCLGVMFAETSSKEKLKKYKNGSLLLRTVGFSNVAFKVKKVIRETWANSSKRYVLVNCGKLDGIQVRILFVVMRHK